MRRSTFVPALLGAALAGATLVGVAPASATTGTPCEKAPWIGQVQGRPKGLTPGARAGDYFWHDRAGFHLRITQKKPRKATTYTGTITSNAPIRDFKWVKLEHKQDSVVLSEDKLTITFKVVNHGWVDGFSFRTSCADSLTVSGLTINTKALPAGKVYLGKTKAHPASIPFTVHRKA